MVPWRPGCRHRDDAWQWVSDQYPTSWQIVRGVHEDGPWNKSLAVAAALTEAAGDVLVVADADCHVDTVTDAVEALTDHSWAIPHRWVHRLTEEATHLLTTTGYADLEQTTDKPYWGVDGGGIVAIRRDVYRDIPLDPRFSGWGGEDKAWGIALHHLAGTPWQGRGRLLHLWHPPQPDSADKRGPRGDRGFKVDTNRRLVDRYRHAKRSRHEMRALVNEAREVLWPSPSS